MNGGGVASQALNSSHDGRKGSAASAGGAGKKGPRLLPRRRTKIEEAAAATATLLPPVAENLVTTSQNGLDDDSPPPSHEPTEHRCSMCGLTGSRSLANLSKCSQMIKTLHCIAPAPLITLESTLASICVQCVYKINAHGDMSRSFKIRMHRLANGLTHSDPWAPTPSLVQPQVQHKDEEPMQDPTSTRSPESSPHNRIESSTQASNSLKRVSPETINGTEAATTSSQRSHLPLSTPTTKLPASTPKRNTKRNAPGVNHLNITAPTLSPIGHHTDDFSAVEALPASPHSTNDEVPKTKKRRRRTVYKKATITRPEPHEAQSRSPSRGVSLRALSTRSNNVSSRSAVTNDSLLMVSRERTESALITEYVSSVNNYHQRGRRLLPPRLSCKNCERVYIRKDHYAKHVERCHVPHRNAGLSTTAPVGLKRIQPQNADLKNATAVVGAESKMDTTDTAKKIINKKRRRKSRMMRARSAGPRTYHCNHCAVTVKSMRKLREHKNIHLVRYNCPTCRLDFTAFYDFEFHKTVCMAKHEVESMRMTRSRSLAASEYVAHSVYSCSTRGFLESAYGYDEDYDNDEEDDGVSVADTMYTKRMRYTGNWVEDHHSISSISLCEEICDEDNKIDSDKEYDLYLLSRYKAQMETGKFACLADGCRYKPDDLVGLLLHDYSQHFKSSWYYCKKCSHVFTSKVFLDYHLDRQDSGRFVCNRCSRCFDYQRQLDCHIISHKKFVNHCCKFCQLEFLSEQELKDHCEHSNHDPEGDHTLVRIDHDMTIVNETPPEPTATRIEYKVTVIEMNLPKTANRRVSPKPSIMPSLPHRRHIGELQFNNQKNPNCCGWSSCPEPTEKQKQPKQQMYGYQTI